MFSILRPFLFNLDPETAHDLAIKTLKFNLFPSKVFKVEDEQMLNIDCLTQFGMFTMEILPKKNQLCHFQFY